MKKVFMVLFVIITLLMVSCKSQRVPEIYIEDSAGASWDGEYSGISVEGVSSQVSIDENQKLYVIIRGRIANIGTKDWDTVWLTVELVTPDDRVGGFSEGSIRWLYNDSEVNFEIRIDDPALGSYHLDYSLKAYELKS